MASDQDIQAWFVTNRIASQGVHYYSDGGITTRVIKNNHVSGRTWKVQLLLGVVHCALFRRVAEQRRKRKAEA